MPIYEYKCTNGHVFDVMQRFSDEPLTECQVCGAPVQKVLFSPSIHFKGSGFHNTDYGTRRRPRSGSESSESSGSGESSGSSESSGDSKSESSSGSDSSNSTAKAADKAA